MIRYSTFLPNNVIPIIYLVLNKLNNKYISFFLLYCRKMSSHALQQQKILKQTLDGTISMVCCRRQPKIKPILLKIYVVVRVKIVPTESIQPSFMLREQGGGGLSIMKTILRKTTKEQFKSKYQNQSREQTLV